MMGGHVLFGRVLVTGQLDVVSSGHRSTDLDGPRRWDRENLSFVRALYALEDQAAAQRTEHRGLRSLQSELLHLFIDSLQVVDAWGVFPANSKQSNVHKRTSSATNQKPELNRPKHVLVLADGSWWDGLGFQSTKAGSAGLSQPGNSGNGRCQVNHARLLVFHLLFCRRRRFRFAARPLARWSGSRCCLRCFACWGDLLD